MFILYFRLQIKRYEADLLIFCLSKQILSAWLEIYVSNLENGHQTIAFA